ncbi:MAG: ferritin family protein [Candidatus Sulfobium sp.]|jgi:rubrerythrin
MDIYEYAMKMEKDGENLYRELASKSGNKGLTSILGMLADAEVKHYKLFQNMKNNEKVTMTDTTILDDVKNVFEKIKEEKQFEVNVSEIDLYKEARDIEKKSRDFYIEKADEVGADRKEIFLKIADEEKRHYFIVENIINFVNKPNTWLENPEWYHLEEY